MELFFVIGNLGADAELKIENGNEFVRFSVAETRKFTDAAGNKKEETMWNSCIMNGRNEKLLPYLTKGTKVCVIGRGSTRIYSSPAEKRMMAGINISVDRLELIQVNSESVPRRVIDPATGSIYDTYKFYFLAPDVVSKIAQFPYHMVDERGGQYVVNEQGCVLPVQSAEPATTSNQSREDGEVF